MINHVVDHGYGHLAFTLDPSRTVVTFHDALLFRAAAHEIPGVEPFPRVTLWGQRYSMAAIVRVAAVITPSEASRRDFLRFASYDEHRVHVVPLGVSDAFASQGRDHVPERQAGDPFRILHAGHCGPSKNIEALVQALPLIARQLEHPVRLVKVGLPFSSSQRALISQLRVDDSIEHLGFVDSSVLPRIYASCDVLVLPSRYEGFGLPVLEAMAAQIPVIASRAGALPEVVGDAGVLVDPDDVGGLADAVVAILTDDTRRRQLVQRGADRARGYTWDRTASLTLDVYHRVDGEAD
jgi:alpha-1,3-rhamnosyl/mannosyltransferase